MSEKEQKSYLFLQGPHSNFFRELGGYLKRLNHKVLRVNFNGGDLFYWHDENSIDYTGEAENWPEFLRELDESNNFTDIIVYGDCRFYHSKAIEYFKTNSKRVHVFEEGYLRPFWITLEKDGVNDNSNIPRDSGIYNKYDKITEKEPNSTKPSLSRKILKTYIYYIFRSFYEDSKFSNYRSHRFVSPEIEARGWLKKLIKKKFQDYFELKKQEKFLKEKKKFFLLALQLSCDSQIKYHSNFNDMREVIDKVCEDFAENAKANIDLVIKSHPEDNGLDKLKKYAKCKARELNIESRLHFFEGGNMPNFLRNMEAMITINSTSGISALIHNKPVLALGKAIYNFEGLTSQQSLSEFWNSPQKPEEDLIIKFKSYLINETQINGSFYSKDGIDMIIENLRDKI